MYKDDVAARLEEEKEADKEEVEIEEGGTSGEANALNDLAQLVQGMKAEMDLGFKSVYEKLDGFDERMKKVESYVNFKKLDEVNDQRPQDHRDRQEEAREMGTEAPPAVVADAHTTEETNEEPSQPLVNKKLGKRPRAEGGNNPSRPMTRSRKPLEEPSQPLEEPSQTSKVQLLDKVEVFYENNWRKGVVRGMLEGGRVRVCIYDSKEEHDFGVDEFRLL